MSLLGYSSSYFLPEYWSNTPFYGEKLIPLLDYMLSTEYEESEKLAQAYYNIQNKYKNPLDLPISQIEAILEECGYKYILDLLGGNEDRIRVLLSVIGAIHQLKGSKAGIKLVLSLMRSDSNALVFQVIGNPKVTGNKIISDFSVQDFVIFKGFIANTDKMELNLKFRTFKEGIEQCIFSVSDYGIYVGIDSNRNLILSLSSNRQTWDIANRVRSNRTIQLNKEYWLKLTYDGYEYDLQLSTDGNNYETWIAVNSSKNLGIYEGSIYMGVDATENVIKNPLNGIIDYSDFSIAVENIEITQWFENFPVTTENTFAISTEIDLDLVTSEFFSNFANFVRNYVYPTLTAFKVNMKLTSNLTFLPYTRQKMIYNAFSEV